MKTNPARGSDGVGLALRTALCIAALLAAAAGRAAADSDGGYLLDDAHVTGKEIHAFEDQGQRVSVILGNCRLRVGKRSITARDGVLWVQQETAGEVARRELVIYLKGSARIVEPDGTTVSDRVMLVTLRHHGRLTAEGTFVDQPLKDYPLYREAVAARERYLSRGEGPDKGAVRIARPPAPPQKPAGEPPRPAPPPPPPAARLPAMEIVTIRLGSVNTRVVKDAQGIERRITICRADEQGPIYLALGTRKSKEYLELRADAAVLFSESRPPRDVRVPWAPQISGVASTLAGGAADWKETVTGVYLDGDARIDRGERLIRGSVAYYDFTTDRAIILDSVFRTIQEQRNIPVYLRAEEMRALSAREMWFRDARISTSEFHSPTYHIGAKTAYLMDTTPYDEEGEPLAERSYAARLKHATFNVRSFPLLYWPYTQSRFQEDHTALRTVHLGRHGRFGFGAETEWHLFRLLGLLRPEGYRGRLELNWYERGPMVGTKIWYARQDYHGYAFAYGLMDQEKKDDFGDEREDIEAARTRGRVLLRHKQFLPNDWMLQLELSYLCDRNFLEQFFRDEFYSGKEQETLIYAKKQKDNWAATALVKGRLNRFDTQAESWPDLGFWLLGEPLLRDRLSFYHESHAGLKRMRYANFLKAEDSRTFARLDTRNEIDLPLTWGPVTITPYAVGRATYWDDAPADGERCRLYGQVGLRAITHVWRVFNAVHSRLFDLNRLRHILTPEVTAFLASSGGVQPKHLYPLDADVEQHLARQSGLSVALHQRLQTKRGAPGEQHTVDWMRLSVVAGFYSNGDDPVPSDGRFFWYRPESSLGRNHVNAEYTWNISDSTALLGDLNWDVDGDRIARANLGLAVVRDPRLRYYVGWRYIADADSSVGTFGLRYQLSEKYSMDFLEQFDFDFRGRSNLATRLSIVRKLPRWYCAVTFTYDEREDAGDFGVLLTFWPEGIPEVRLGSSRLRLLGASSLN
jgi:hypothetical protein